MVNYKINKLIQNQEVISSNNMSTLYPRVLNQKDMYTRTKERKDVLQIWLSSKTGHSHHGGLDIPLANENFPLNSSNQTLVNLGIIFAKKIGRI